MKGISMTAPAIRGFRAAANMTSLAMDKSVVYLESVLIAINPSVRLFTAAMATCSVTSMFGV